MAYVFVSQIADAVLNFSTYQSDVAQLAEIANARSPTRQSINHKPPLVKQQVWVMSGIQMPN